MRKAGNNTKQVESRAASHNNAAAKPVQAFSDNRPETLNQQLVQRMANNYIQSNKLSSSPVTGSQQPIQRYAFEQGKWIDPNDPYVNLEKDLGFTPNMLSVVYDNKIRDFASTSELDKYSKGQTDYIGNLPDGTWLRFNPQGLNGIGENHTEIVLSDTLKAVDGLKGGKWVHEKFSDVAEEVGQDSLLNQKLIQEHKGVHKDYELGETNNETPHAAESVLPKLGYGLTLMLQSYNSGGMLKLEGLKSNGYVGKPLATIFQMSWYFGQDVLAAETHKKQLNDEYEIPGVTQFLLATIEETKGDVGALAASIKYGEFLGDLIDPGNQDLRKGIIKFAAAMTAYLVYIKSNDNSGTVSHTRKQEFEEANTYGKQHTAFANLRNDRFTALVAKAKGNGYRYAGMGNNHLDEGPMRLLLGESHCFDMTSGGGSNYNKFKTYTNELRSKIP